ncbi:MAG: hypothetical protein QGI83_09665, partial [Candidatus Latescibacteria bacterium]|nr:hypothetical protein [Candidatus Latescibacterota bacterium]
MVTEISDAYQDLIEPTPGAEVKRIVLRAIWVRFCQELLEAVLQGEGKTASDIGAERVGSLAPDVGLKRREVFGVGGL